MGMLDFLSMKKSVEATANHVQELDRAVETAKQERDEINCMVVSKDDAIHLLHRRIDAYAAGYPADLARGLAAFLPGHKAERLAQNFPLGMLLPQAAGAGRDMSAETWIHGASFLLREPLKKAITEAVNAAPWPEKTISMAERVKRLAELDKRIGELEAQAREIREQAAAAGIVIR